MTREKFLEGYQNWDNYKPLLWDALEKTTGDIVEMGMGNGSTKLLHDYATDRKRMLYSYEYDFTWYKKFKNLKSPYHSLTFVDGDWGIARIHESIGTLFIDHSPGERRKVDLEYFRNIAQVIVVHDSEPKGWNASDYQVRPILEKFEYKVDHIPDKGGAWATMVSNSVALL